MVQPQRPSSSRPSSRSSRRPSGNSSRITGDSQQRVTVPLPRSFQELQNKAVRLFGNGGELKMYHHGLLPIQDPSQLSKIQDGDVVVVTLGDRRLTSKEFARLLLTTNQRDDVEHPLSTPKAPVVKPKPKLPAVPLPFDGVTSYQSNYVKHPLDKYKPEAAAKPASTWTPQKSSTGKSTYEEQYPWRDAPVSEIRALLPSREATRRKSEPFTGCTCYMQDYVKPPMEPKKPETASPARPRQRAASLPFQGTSS
jgi:hypothetical protein